jgi:hypothetical protein
VAATGNTNVTKKGTKQRSFNLDDSTFAIVEAEAARLHITNSAALSMLLNAGAPTRIVVDSTDQRHVMLDPVTQQPQRDLSYLLPSDTATTFEVKDPDKPHVSRRRAKLDDKLVDKSDVTSKTKTDDFDLGDR